jgi:EamA domain-containing membrane protein RarD
MLPIERQRRAGTALVIVAAIAWSAAPFFTRLLHFDSWTILFWRGLFGGSSISLFLIVSQGWRGASDLVTMRANG